MPCFRSAVLRFYHQMSVLTHQCTPPGGKLIILYLSIHFVYRIMTCSSHLPRYTVLTGSTARAVATRSSALCLRPLTMSRPSILPTTKIRLPYTKQRTHTGLGGHYPLSIQTHLKEWEQNGLLKGSSSHSCSTVMRQADLLGQQTPGVLTAQMESLLWERRLHSQGSPEHKKENRN